MSYSEELNTLEEFNIIENKSDIECDDSISIDDVLNETNNDLEEESELKEVQEQSIMEEPIKEVKQEESLPEFVNVKIKFPNSATPVDCVSAATNCREKIVAANKQIRLLQNRFYFIPVDCDERIDSDQYGNIKVYSTQADKIDVRYVKNGFACLIAMKHNIKLYDDELLAVLY